MTLRESRARWIAAALAVAGAGGCGEILGLEDPVDPMDAAVDLPDSPILALGRTACSPVDDGGRETGNASS